ncbi:hypothetical protein V1L52_02255 [Treponema sp. HNW]|uniref:hypothetical protein n=1 Tax=Treponema sp. HNW TaxID=3116654 RepID=UPI003D0C7ACA
MIRIKKVRTVLFVLCICMLAGLPLSAFDWGGFVLNDTGIKGPANADFIKNFTQANRLTLWMRTPLPNLKDSYFAAEGFYDFKYSYRDKTIKHAIDLTLAKFSMSVNEPGLNLTFNMGRYGIADLSGFIFAQNADGMELRFKAEKWDAKFYAGYTGFLNADTVNMNIPQLAEGNKVYQAAPPIVIGSAFASFPQLFKQQTLSCEVTALGAAHDPALFTTLSLHGPVNPLFYAVSSTLAFTHSGTKPLLFSNISRFELTAYFPIMSSFVSWNTVFATGSTGKKIGEFKSLSIIPANLSGSLKYAGHVKTGLTGSIKPISSLLCTLNTDMFFNVMNASPAKGFAGAQWQAAVRWQIYNDLQLSVSAGQFFAASAQKTAPYTLTGIRLLYSF